MLGKSDWRQSTSLLLRRVNGINDNDYWNAWRSETTFVLETTAAIRRPWQGHLVSDLTTLEAIACRKLSWRSSVTFSLQL